MSWQGKRLTSKGGIFSSSVIVITGECRDHGPCQGQNNQKIIRKKPDQQKK